MRLKDTVRDEEAAAPVTEIEYDPAGVDAEVDSVRVDAQLGVHDEMENEPVLGMGKPAIDKETGSIVPDTAVIVTLLDADCPCVRTRFPPADKEKLKGMALLTVTASAVEVV